MHGRRSGIAVHHDGYDLSWATDEGSRAWWVPYRVCWRCATHGTGSRFLGGGIGNQMDADLFAGAGGETSRGAGRDIYTPGQARCAGSTSSNPGDTYAGFARRVGH